MASIALNLGFQPLLLHDTITLFRTLPKSSFSPLGERRYRASIVAKATGESSEAPTSLSIVKSVQSVWDNSEDRVAFIGLGFAAIAAIWASTNLVLAIDKLPLIPNTLELIGILYSSWFIYRYLLFKPNREELYQIINKSISDVLGQ